MEFKEFKDLFQQHITKILAMDSPLFVVDTDKDELWDLYLNSFPEGTNVIFRERREYDCSCCRHFIKTFGNVVVIKNNKLISIWDFKTKDEKYQTVIDALSKFIKSKPIQNIFVTKINFIGTDSNFEEFKDGTIHTWNHFYVKLPKEFASTSAKSEASEMGSYRDIKNVFKRSLEEISEDSIETTLELISQKSLYKGEEWKATLNKFLTLHKAYNKLPAKEKDLFCWLKASKVGGAVGKIKNHSIGTLLIDITNGIDLNEAVKKYEAIVAPQNYKRPKAIFTKKMIQEAQNKIEEMGMLNSLGRRFATIEDITINNVLFANKNSLTQMGAYDVFDELLKESTVSPKKFDKVEEVSTETFVNDILPRAEKIEVFLENKHSPNFMSVIAPENKDSKTMFKWDNNLSWTYQGNITDSMMKVAVKAAGGNIEGILRSSIMWNRCGDNRNDFDLHCIEPNGNHIYYPNRGRAQQSSGMLDVDIISPGNKIAVENQTWTDFNKMQEGRYKFYVHCFSHNGGRKGFAAELEYDGEIHTYEYGKELHQNEIVIIAELDFSKKEGITFIKELPSTTSTKTIWNLQTNQFHPVSVCMYSPNYWDDQKGIGNRHYFFILKECINETSPNGFFNEFLREDLMEFKRVFEALGSKMRVDPSEEQLSGLGFSSTKRNSLICKVEGNFTRTIKLIF